MQRHVRVSPLSLALLISLSSCARMYSIRASANIERVGDAPIAYALDVEFAAHPHVADNNHVDISGQLGAAVSPDPAIRPGFGLGWLWTPPWATALVGIGYASQRSFEGTDHYQSVVQRTALMFPLMRRTRGAADGMIDHIAQSVGPPSLDPVEVLIHPDSNENDRAPRHRDAEVETRLSIGMVGGIGVVATGERGRGSVLWRAGVAVSWDVVGRETKGRSTETEK